MPGLPLTRPNLRAQPKWAQDHGHTPGQVCVCVCLRMSLETAAKRGGVFRFYDTFAATSGQDMALPAAATAAAGAECGADPQLML